MRLLEIRLYRGIGISIPEIQDILSGDEETRKRMLNQIRNRIGSDITKKIEDAEIIQRLTELSHHEAAEVIRTSGNIDKLRRVLLHNQDREGE